MARWRAYLEIARPDHWFKNIFMVPGILLAVFFQPHSLEHLGWLTVVMGFAAVCLTASGNYVLNEVLDSRFDRFHPDKRHRAIPSGRVNIRLAYGWWLVLSAAGVGLGFRISATFGEMAALLWVMGLIYNVPPVRAKDRAYLDVLVESINNPIRMMLGWHLTGIAVMPPLSLTVAYWMFGSFLMAAKRLAEYRHIDCPQTSASYRKSFGWYNEHRLLVSLMFYATWFGTMAGIFISRYRIELVLASPLVAAAVASYLKMTFEPDSAAQKPEKLYRHKGLMVWVTLAILACCIFLFVDVPWVEQAFTPRILPPNHR